MLYGYLDIGHLIVIVDGTVFCMFYVWSLKLQDNIYLYQVFWKKQKKIKKLYI